ncbi:MAG: DUF423 domain-containing protein [Acidobacteriota bacterium]
MARLFLSLGAIFGLLGVAAGAFGAHVLRGRLTPDDLQIFETAVRYQMYHALALLAVGLFSIRFASASATAAGWCFLAGIVIFSGSLYLLVLSGARWWGAVTPIGGVGFLVGWLFLLWAALRLEV